MEIKKNKTILSGCRLTIYAQSPQVADLLSMLQPAKTINQTPIIDSDNMVQQSSRDTGFVLVGNLVL